MVVNGTIPSTSALIPMSPNPDVLRQVGDKKGVMLRYREGVVRRHVAIEDVGSCLAWFFGFPTSLAE
jgi:hypothetical protein